MTNLAVIVSVRTPEVMAYARVLERHGAEIVSPGNPGSPSKAMRDIMARPRPYALTRPCPYNAYGIYGLAPNQDAEGLHPINLGRMVAGKWCRVPAIGQAVSEHLEGKIFDSVRVLGHGLGAVIAAYLGWQNKGPVTLSSASRWTGSFEHGEYIVNAGRRSISGENVLDLPSNPPEFSRRLVELVLERAAKIAE